MSLEQFGATTWPSLRSIEKDDLGDVVCPASGAYADHTRGEIEIPVTRLADEDLQPALEAAGIETLRGRGYESPNAEVLMPESVSGPEAHGYSNLFVGVPAVVDGERASCAKLGIAAFRPRNPKGRGSFAERHPPSRTHSKVRQL